MYGGMYPTMVLDMDGDEIENPVRITLEQCGESAHFLDIYANRARHSW